MQQIEFAGSIFQGLGAATAAWAESVLPDTRVIEASEDPAVAAEELEAFCWTEAQKIGEGAPEDVDEIEWRTGCRSKLAQRIELSRKAVPS